MEAIPTGVRSNARRASPCHSGQLFTKLGREMTVASRRGGPDPDANFRLRLAVQQAPAEATWPTTPSSAL